jgi:hypothetical protein
MINTRLNPVSLESSYPGHLAVQFERSLAGAAGDRCEYPDHEHNSGSEQSRGCYRQSGEDHQPAAGSGVIV